MPFILESVDLEEVFDTEEMVRGWIGDSVQNGRVFYGYSGNAYIHSEYGAVEIYSCIVKNEDEQENRLERADLQVSGFNCWNVCMSEMELRNDTPYNMTRLAVVKNSVTGGLTVMHILNADVLPSFLEDDEIQVQVTAFALDVNYYEDEIAFADTFPECEGMKFEEFNGKKLLPAMGALLPTGFMHNHMVREDGSINESDEDDDLVTVAGIVKGIFVDTVKLDGMDITSFIRTRIESQFGDLDIVHSRQMISDKEFEMLKDVDLQKQEVVIQALVVLSGDAAIFDYENGVVKDKQNDLAALRFALVKGNANRLKTILANDVVYESINSETEIKGKEAVINHLNYVHDNTNIDYFARLATLDESGERCIVLAENEEDNLAAIVRINVSEEGLITKIQVSDVADRTFILDDKTNYSGIWEDDE